MPGFVPQQKIFAIEGASTAWYIAWKCSWLVILLVSSKMLVPSIGFTAVLAVMHPLTLSGFAYPSGLGKLDAAAT